ncbi:folylpolyglutamate synthase/dihydrofolate synthase family protein [Asticcacaulis sp. ZE23SCel15]|uniref:bifunctional folylpolyglutamate synthase/dihydrofolate synthase n=1 Tax=Asticcacaulis sp. ZE23SCel15 TaxID=3059027 RepID=UPI00265E7E04|nr:folylpolyglutamate synthase/dihydrofolate synthase family protein [Asticcacaulis sp. ZE23SCel15]WKL58219.1 folylpolyglutamate synthase/dihydrofolate synthase family protein [Asticcacaulis sp. ZE23SCel15]
MTDRLLPFDAPLERLKALHPKRIDLTLERMLRVCAALGNPHDKLPPVVHVAGTNGKGSTLAFLRAMAEAEGLSVHVYTSPHLVRFAERIRLNGTLIDNDYLADVLNRVEIANNGQALTFFEATTAAAFLAFSERPADLLLLETGLGGILDATNIISAPRLSIITPIDYDHQAFLGNDLTTIAKQKAGIIKPNCPVISARQAEEAETVIERAALKMRSALSVMGQGFDAYRENDRLVFQDDDALLDLSLPRLSGPHQIDNAGLAIKAALALGFSSDAIDRGLQTAVWPGRLQALKAGPLHAALTHKASELWLDGGHNPHAAKALRAHLDILGSKDPKPLKLICGLLNNKDADEFFAAFDGLSLEVVCVGFSSDAATDPATLAAAAQSKGLSATTAISPLEAVKAVQTDAPVRILICGSLYLAGDVLALSEETWPI